MSEIILKGITVDELLERFSKLLESKSGKNIERISSEADKYLTRKEAAKLLRITLPTLHDWTKSRILQSYKIKSRVLYKRNEVEAVLDNKLLQKNNRILF